MRALGRREQGKTAGKPIYTDIEEAAEGKPEDESASDEKNSVER